MAMDLASRPVAVTATPIRTRNERVSTATCSTRDDRSASNRKRNNSLAPSMSAVPLLGLTRSATMLPQRNKKPLTEQILKIGHQMNDPKAKDLAFLFEDAKILHQKLLALSMEEVDLKKVGLFSSEVLEDIEASSKKSQVNSARKVGCVMRHTHRGSVASSGGSVSPNMSSVGSNSPYQSMLSLNGASPDSSSKKSKSLKHSIFAAFGRSKSQKHVSEQHKNLSLPRHSVGGMLSGRQAVTLSRPTSPKEKRKQSFSRSSSLDFLSRDLEDVSEPKPLSTCPGGLGEGLGLERGAEMQAARLFTAFDNRKSQERTLPLLRPISKSCVRLSHSDKDRNEGVSSAFTEAVSVSVPASPTSSHRGRSGEKVNGVHDTTNSSVSSSASFKWSVNKVYQEVGKTRTPPTTPKPKPKLPHSIVSVSNMATPSSRKTESMSVLSASSSKSTSALDNVASGSWKQNLKSPRSTSLLRDPSYTSPPSNPAAFRRSGVYAGFPPSPEFKQEPVAPKSASSGPSTDPRATRPSVATLVDELTRVEEQVGGGVDDSFDNPMRKHSKDDGIRRPQVTASSATLELDQLMENLEHFVPPVPALSDDPSAAQQKPKSAMDNLSNMLGSLEQDMKIRGVSTVAKGICAACKKPILAKMLDALEQQWHPEHFTCAACDMELANTTYYESNGRPYCEKDYHELYAPRCAYCNGPILERVMRALDKTWHPEHFFCTLCGKKFGPEGFHEKDSKAFCRECYYENYAPHCKRCDKSIMEGFITALNAQWHPECFSCKVCNVTFPKGNYFEHEGEPHCELHYHASRGTLCASCQKPVTGKCVTAMGRKWHPEHFTCAFCLKLLNKGTFKEHRHNPYCQPCYIKLFG